MTVDVGLLYQRRAGRRPGEAARSVEARGFDSLWVGDHVMSYVDGITAAAIMGAATDRITIGNAVVVAPLRHPALLARSVASLQDELGGRYILGCGAGGDVQADFDVAGVPLDERGSRMEDTVTSVRSALDDGELRGHQFEDRPAAGSPPVWFGGRSERAARRAGALGDGFLPYLVTPHQYRSLSETVTRARESRAAPSRHPFGWGAIVMVSVAPVTDQAWQAAAAHRPYGLDDDVMRRYSVVGDPELCVRGLRQYLDAGVEHLVLHVIATADAEERQVDILAGLLDALRSAK